MDNCEFTDSCKYFLDCETCGRHYTQCFGVKCADFEPFIEITDSELN